MARQAMPSVTRAGHEACSAKISACSVTLAVMTRIARSPMAAALRKSGRFVCPAWGDCVIRAFRELKRRRSKAGDSFSSLERAFQRSIQRAKSLLRIGGDVMQCLLLKSKCGAYGSEQCFNSEMPVPDGLRGNSLSRIAIGIGCYGFMVSFRFAGWRRGASA